MTDSNLTLLFNRINFYKDAYLTKSNVEECLITPLIKFLDDYIISSPGKVILIFKEYTDYVIKIPLSSDESMLDYSFYNKITPEINLYNFLKTIQAPFWRMFKPYELLSPQLPYPIYKQEKITLLSTNRHQNIPLEEREMNISFLTSNISTVNKDAFSLKGFQRGNPVLMKWYVDILKEYDKDTFNLLLMFLQSSKSFLDININNVGYDKNNKPCIIDYSLR